MVIHFASLLLAQSMFGGLPIDGIRCDTVEGVVEHIHTHLVLKQQGARVTVPAGVGVPQDGRCLYWLHTHSDDGTLHIESPVRRAFTLGNFFDIWGRPLSRTQAAWLHGRLRVSVNGKPWRGNPRDIPLRDDEEIVISDS